MDVFVFSNNDSVPSVVAALAAHDQVGDVLGRLHVARVIEIGAARHLLHAVRLPRGQDLALALLEHRDQRVDARPEALDLARVDAYGAGQLLGRQRIVRLPVDELFDTVVDSSAEGIRKPDHRIYHLALERLGGVEPHRAVFVDDFEANVAAAEAVGLTGVLVSDTEPLAAGERVRELLGLG